MENQIAVVTGGAQGIGLAVARLLIQKGVLVASWDIDPGNKDAMADLGSNAMAVDCKINDLATVEAAYARTCEAFGVPSILINSAGIPGRMRTWMLMTLRLGNKSLMSISTALSM